MHTYHLALFQKDFEKAVLSILTYCFTAYAGSRIHKKNNQFFCIKHYLRREHTTMEVSTENCINSLNLQIFAEPILEIENCAICILRIMNVSQVFTDHYLPHAGVLVGKPIANTPKFVKSLIRACNKCYDVNRKRVDRERSVEISALGKRTCFVINT